jgi:hypothetical protein
LEDNIKMDLREIGLEGVDWIHLAEDRDQWWTLGWLKNNVIHFSFEYSVLVHSRCILAAFSMKQETDISLTML